MRYDRTNIGKCLFLVPLLAMTLLCSCEEETEEWEEFKLTGNIESLIPDYSYSIEHSIAASSDGTNYLVAKTDFLGVLDTNLEYWGLRVKNIRYYVDDTLLETVSSSPYGMACPVADIGLGDHTLKAKITVCGEECDDAVLEKSDDFNVPSTNSTKQTYARIYVDYNYVCKGENFQLTPYILEERSPEGSKITKVEYYWDNKLIETKTASPFTWSYPVTDEAGTSHSVKAVIRYSYGSNSTGIYNFSFDTYTIMDDDDCHYWWTRKLSDNDDVYQNGETVEGVAKCYQGKNYTDKISLKLYYDDKLIGESSTFPYEIDYKLVNQSVGFHTFKPVWTKTHPDGTNNTSTTESTIIVLP